MLTPEIALAVARMSGAPVLSAPLTPSKLRKRELGSASGKDAAAKPAADEPLPTTACVLTNGSDALRVMFGGNLTIRKRIPAILGKQKPAPLPAAAPKSRKKGTVIESPLAPPPPQVLAGEAAMQALHTLEDIVYPIREGRIQDWVRVARRFGVA